MNSVQLVQKCEAHFTLLIQKKNKSVTAEGKVVIL